LKKRTLSWDRETERTLNLEAPAWSESARARSNNKSGSSLGYHDLLREIELTGGLAYEGRPRAFSRIYDRVQQKTTTTDRDDGERPEVEEVFIITNSGLLVERYSYTKTTPIDGDIFSGMFKAVQCFVEDSFGSRGGSTGLKELRMGNLVILITQGKYLTVVVIAKAGGGDMRILEPGLKEILSRYESENKKALRSWFGDRGAIKGLKKELDAVLLDIDEE